MGQSLLEAGVGWGVGGVLCGTLCASVSLMYICTGQCRTYFLNDTLNGNKTKYICLCCSFQLPNAKSLFDVMAMMNVFTCVIGTLVNK